MLVVVVDTFVHSPRRLTRPRCPASPGKAAATHCNVALSEKAALADYLAAHRGSVAQLLGTDTSAAAAAAVHADYSPRAARHYDSSGAPLGTTGRASMASSGSAWEAGGSLLAQPPVAPPAAAVRRASVAAYLRGSQDLATTITSGVPYISDPAAALRTAAQQDYATRASISSSLGSAGSSPEPGSGSRHTAVKDAIAARVCAAGG